METEKSTIFELLERFQGAKNQQMESGSPSERKQPQKPPPQQGESGFDRPFVFVSGKGGVGKSLVAGALALRAARSGKKTLLVETGDRSYFADFFGLSPVDHIPRRIDLGFDIALWSGESCLKEYVLHLLKLERLYKIFFENKVMRALTGVAPGLNEIAILGKITSGVRKVGPPLAYDRIIVDMPATGHALAMFRAPGGLAEAIQVGPMALHAGEMKRLLNNPAQVALVAVTLLEELPVAETLEFVDVIRREFSMPTEIVANRRLEVSLTAPDFREVQAAAIPGYSDYAGGVADTLELQSEMARRLERALGSVHFLPRFYSREPREMVILAEEALRKT